ncbi:MAG: DUF1573 domain-containing protein [Prevotellaceae bacterium]|jgi:hypothetical protein|nr:DUF1573 domain-containing protein [Prevotellaceae bacterium]
MRSIKRKELKHWLILIAIFAVEGISAQEIAPVIDFESKKYDFDEINLNQDSVVQTTFIFMNKGSSPLVIYKVTASCGCTIPECPMQQKMWKF